MEIAVSLRKRTSTLLCGRQPGQNDAFVRHLLKFVCHRYERAVELEAIGEIEIQDWTQHGESEKRYIRASPAWVCLLAVFFLLCDSQLPICKVIKNIYNPVHNPVYGAARKAANEEAARQYLLEHGSTGLLSQDVVDQVCNPEF